ASRSRVPADRELSVISPPPAPYLTATRARTRAVTGSAVRSTVARPASPPRRAIISVTSRPMWARARHLAMSRSPARLARVTRAAAGPGGGVRRRAGQGERQGPPVGREVDDGGRLALGEQHVPAQVAVDQLARRPDRAQRGQQAAHLAGQPGRDPLAGLEDG